VVRYDLNGAEACLGDKSMASTTAATNFSTEGKLHAKLLNASKILTVANRTQTLSDSNLQPPLGKGAGGFSTEIVN
jgi:hypothetical protein